METVIITGISGAGKTQAIDYLEDFGYYCIDNMPIQLLPTFLDLCSEAGQNKVAIVTDIRSVAFSKDLISPRELYKLKNDDQAKILFLDCNDQTLLRRYQQTRRRHPLSQETGSLENAISRERTIMKEMKDVADMIIDTSELKPAELYEDLKELFDQHDSHDTMLINVISFGFKYGPPRSADFVFDTRFLVNPFWVEELRDKTGEDVEVREFVMKDPVAKEYLDNIITLIDNIIPSYIKVDKTHLTLAFGCTGGQHRSVTFAYLVAEAFREKGYEVKIDHKNILHDRFLKK